MAQYQILNRENNSLIFEVLFLFFSFDRGELKVKTSAFDFLYSGHFTLTTTQFIFPICFALQVLLFTVCKGLERGPTVGLL